MGASTPKPGPTTVLSASGRNHGWLLISVSLFSVLAPQWSNEHPTRGQDIRVTAHLLQLSTNHRFRLRLNNPMLALVSQKSL